MTYHFLDAGVHYGNSIPDESIPALLLVDGWNNSCLLILIGLAALTAIIGLDWQPLDLELVGDEALRLC